MHGQHAMDGTADGLVANGGGGVGAVAGREPTATIASLFGTPPNRKEETMTQVETFEEAPAASLVGSLSVFTLSDVLTMLAATAQTGELQLVSGIVDGKLWLAQGELSDAHVGTATTVGQAVFELACIAEGWFYFTSGLASSNGQPSIPVATMLSDVRPQVDEWRELRQVVPFEATVSLSPTSPGHDVQIRSDQWQVLTTVGHGGHTVKTVIESIGGDQMVGMRSIRDLRTAGLIVVGAPTTESVPDQLADSYRMATQESVPSASLPAPPPPMDMADQLAGHSSDLDAVTNSDQQLGDLAAVSLMPPPIASDPWTPVVEASAGAGDNGVA